MTAWDVVVIGGGHNGLAAANSLARKGRKVLVLEASARVGGIAAGDEVAPGFSTRGLLLDTSRVAPELVRRLSLETRSPPPVLGLEAEGPGLLLARDPAAAAAEITAHSAADAKGYSDWRRWTARVGKVLRRLMETEPFELGVEAPLWPLLRAGVGLRRLGRRDMMEVLRVAPGSADDWVREFVETPLLQAMIVAPGLRGTWMGPRSPSSATTLLLHEALVGREVVGGPQGLVDALLADCTKRGVEVRTEQTVTRIRVEGGKVVGLEVDGQALDATTVLSTVGPRRTLLELVDPLVLSGDLHREASNIRTRGTLGSVAFALKDRPVFSCRPDLEVEVAHTGASTTLLEKAFDHAKHRRMPSAPPMELRVHREEGGWVLHALVRCAAFGLEGGWSPDRHRELGDLVEREIAGLTREFSESILAREVLTPADLARRYRLEGGHEMHAELGLDQLHALRPTRRLARYATPVSGLWLGSAGSHPGGGVTGRPGLLAAQALLRGR